MNNAITGFLWGLGFAIACVLVILVVHLIKGGTLPF
jgi:hypothetical protein